MLFYLPGSLRYSDQSDFLVFMVAIRQCCAVFLSKEDINSEIFVGVERDGMFLSCLFLKYEWTVSSLYLKMETRQNYVTGNPILSKFETVKIHVYEKYDYLWKYSNKL